MKIKNIDFNDVTCVFCNSELLIEERQDFVIIRYCSECPKSKSYPKYQVYHYTLEPNAFMICYLTNDYLIRQIINLNKIDVYKVTNSKLDFYVSLPIMNLNSYNLNNFCNMLNNISLFI